MAVAWKALWDELGIPADEFIRTTDIQHVRTVQWLFKTVQRKRLRLQRNLHWAILHLRQRFRDRSEAGRQLS